MSKLKTIGNTVSLFSSPASTLLIFLTISMFELWHTAKLLYSAWARLILSVELAEIMKKQPWQTARKSAYTTAITISECSQVNLRWFIKDTKNIERGYVLLFCWLDEVYSIHGGQWLPSLVYVFNHYKRKTKSHTIQEIDLVVRNTRVSWINFFYCPLN